MPTKRNTNLRKKYRDQIARHKPPCAICGQPINYELKYPDPNSFVIDHKLPLHRHGTNTIDNLQAAHNKCNRLKSDKLYANIIKNSGVLSC